MAFLRLFRKFMLDNLVGCEVVICPPATLLRDMAEKVPGTHIKLGGQNCHFAKEGAYTGEISAAMLKDMMCDYVILGHSERRVFFQETSETIQKKVETAHSVGLRAIVCIGETLDERKKGNALAAVKSQLLSSLPASATGNNTVIAYEPVWAIGTGHTPTAEEIHEMHGFIGTLLKNPTKKVENCFRIVYGGSVKKDNAKGILAIEGVNGLLVGKASLDFESFSAMVRAAG